MDGHGQNSAVDKFLEDELESPVRHAAVFEEQVAQSIQVLHLDVCGGDDIGLLVVGRQSDRHICVLRRVLVGLVGDDAHHIAELAIH